VTLNIPAQLLNQAMIGVTNLEDLTIGSLLGYCRPLGIAPACGWALLAGTGAGVGLPVIGPKVVALE
jgi:hypothetical protein